MYRCRVMYYATKSSRQRTGTGNAHANRGAAGLSPKEELIPQWHGKSFAETIMMCFLFAHGRVPIALGRWRVFFILAAALAAVSQPAFAKTNYLSGVDQVTVAAAALLASDGDVFVFPAGTASYATPVTFSKAVTLQGTPGQTTIVNSSGNRYGFAFMIA